MSRDDRRVLTVEEMCVGTASRVEDVVRKIGGNLMGVAFVTDAEDRLVGSVTDGDLRRALLEGRLDLSMPVAEVMNTRPSVISVGSGAEATFAALSAGVREGKSVFPRVDDQGRVQSFAFRENWGLVPIAEPMLSGNEKAYVMECLDSNWISSTGPFVEQFEREFSTFTGLPNPVACSNGTAAITLALQALGIPKGAEVIVPNCTFAATANAVIAAGGRVVLADVDEATWGLSPETVEPLVGPETWGVIAVHLYGNPCDVVGLRSLCDERRIVMVEDCAEAIGTYADGRHVGALSDAASFSFFGNKTITTGEGGMVFFRGPERARRAGIIRAHGVSAERRYWHEIVGFNYRMTNLQAAVGLAQTERAEELVRSKLTHALEYAEGLDGLRGLRMMPSSSFGRCSFWLVPILVDGSCERRDMVMEALAARGIQSRETFPPLNQMPAFAGLRGAGTFPVSERIADNGLCLPNNPGMSSDDVQAAILALREFANV